MVPKVDDSHESRCKLVTKKLTVDTKKADIGNPGSGGGDARGLIVIMAGAGVVYSVSAIVSGSIMVAGNTIHWIEQEGRCDDGVIKNAIENLSRSLRSAGAWIVTSAEDIINWFKFNKEN